MRSIKRKTALLSLALCMSLGMTGCEGKKGEKTVDLSDYLVTIAPQEDRRTSYETYTLEVTSYVTHFSTIASAKYEETGVIAEIPYGNPVPLGYLVTNNQVVNAGAPIFRYRLEFDEVYMAEQRLSYTRKSERFEAYKVKEEKRLAEVLAEVAKLPVDTEIYANALIDYQEQLKAYNEYVEQTQAEIEELGKEVAAFDNNGKIFTVNAPVSGIVSVPFRMYYVADGAEVATIQYPYTDIYAADNQYENLMVGQKVIGDYNEMNGETHTVEGVVLSADSLLPLKLQSGSAYIRFDLPEGMKTTPASIHAVIETVNMQDIIRIPKNLVKQHLGANYIEILTDEGITRKNIEIFTEIDLDYVVLDKSLAGLKVIKR